MISRVRVVCAVVILVLAVVCTPAGAERSGDRRATVPRITVEELRSMMERGEEVYVIDMRSPRSYAVSRHRIRGDVRIPVHELSEKAALLPGDAEIVTYCT